MSSSPATPTGTGRNDASTTNVSVFAMGRPMGMVAAEPCAPSGSADGVQVSEPTVVSVGP
jgi:hypothetical protein